MMAEHVVTVADELRVSFASDINPLLAEAFLEEAPVHASRFSAVMGRLASEHASFEDVVLAQRVAHSLKGSASITGVSAIASLTHQAEDILDWLADDRALPPASLRDLLVDTADCVAAMVDALTVQGPLPHSTERVLTRLYEWREQHINAAQPLHQTEAETETETETEAGTEAGTEAEAEVEAGTGAEVFDAAAPDSPRGADSLNTDEAPAPLTAATSTSAASGPAPRNDRAAAVQPAATSLRVPVSLVDRLLRLAGELAITNVQAQGAQHRMAARANHLREHYHLLQQRLSDLQDLVEIRGVPSRASKGSARRTSIGDFDPLEMDEYNELHSKNTALAEAVTDFCELALEMRPELTKLEDTVADQQRISKELSDSVLSARMVPVGNVEQRLARTVRETCRATDKEAELVIIGGAISVDGDVLNALMDPLLHLLRNAVDHGIEMPAQREAAGKRASGRLEVRFARDGENVLVQVSDDGAGFDLKGIREVAQQRGIVTKEDFRADRELLQLTVAAGFSTRREASEVSGRGIGMDIVQRAVLDLKGSLDIISTPGNGASVSLRVPLTLISMHVLLVRAGSQIFGVPSALLQQVLSADRSQLRDQGMDVKFTKEESEYSVRRLDQLVGRCAATVECRKLVSMLMLEADSGPTAIVVDEALDGRYLVVNSLGSRVPRPPGVIGACVLGDGGVAPVLDIRELLRWRPVAASGEARTAMPESIKPQALAAEVLVVDDSLTARRMLTIAIGDAGYRVRTAIDGLDAVEAIEDAIPDLLVTDLEMPRMNGLERSAHLRADEATANLPILMVTSRSTQKHRAQAQGAGINDFITKPYATEELLAMVARLLRK